MRFFLVCRLLGISILLPFLPGMFCPVATAQPIDSIQKRVAAAKNDTEKVNILIELSDATDCADSVRKLDYATRATLLAEKAGWGKGLYKANQAIGTMYYGCNGDYAAAVAYYHRALSAAQQIGDKDCQAVALNAIGQSLANIDQYVAALESYGNVVTLKANTEEEIAALANMGRIYSAIGDFPAALVHYDSSLKELERSMKNSNKNTVYDSVQLASLLVATGDVYREIKQYDNALDVYRNALVFGEKTRKDFISTIAYAGIARTYKFRDDFEHAIEYYNKALEKCKAIKNKSTETDLLDQLATVYLEMGDANRAMDFSKKALNLAQQNEQSNLLHVFYTTLGKIDNKQGKYREAITYLEKAIALSNKNGELAFERDALEALSTSYEKTNQPALALGTYRRFISIRDSITNLDKANEITRIDLKSKYDRQKLADDAVANLEIQKQRLWTYGGFGGLALVVLLSFFIYRNYANQKKANALITIEKENAEVQRQRAERSEAFKQQFLANMSHEIRTPMNAVSGMTDLLIDKNPRADQLNYLQVISKSSDILLHIINDILDLSKIEAGKLEMEQIDFSLADTVQLVRETLSVKSEEKGLHLLTHIGPGIQDVLVGDPFRINQVLINLGGNAIKFTERGSVEINVQQLSEDDTSATLKFSVIDTGAGIPEDKLNSLFENFKQVHSSDSRKYGGTGLGLSISKQLVELQGGSISVESKEGSGTTFSFILTLPRGSAGKLAERTRSEQKADGSVLNGLRILLADDNEYNRLVANEALTLKAKVTIAEAHNGEEAIKMLQEADYDVILMDVLMPVMNGLDATRYIRAHLPEPKNGIPIIALTASMLRNDLDKCVQAGMNTYVPKPFKTWQLIAAIAQVTGRTNFIPIREVEEMPGAESVSGKGDIVTDIAGLVKFCENDMDRVKKYVSIYLKAVPPFEANATAAMAAKDTEAVATLVHTFKPKWAMMGMVQSIAVCKKIEESYEQQRDTDAIFDHLATLVDFNRLSAIELLVIV